MWQIDSTKVCSLGLAGTHQFLMELFSWVCQQDGSADLASLENLATKAHPIRLGMVAARTKVKSHMAHLAQLPDRDDIYRNYLEMSTNYRTFHLAARVYAPPHKSSEAIVKQTFDYFYEELIHSQVFSSLYLYDGFTMQHYRESLGRISGICPYCNRREIDLPCDSSLDHYLPKSHFPLLSLHWENLVPACTACNDRLKRDKGIVKRGKTKIFVPAMHPYFDEAARYIRFSFDGPAPVLAITSESEPHRARVKNYIDLFELPTVYQSKSVCRDLDDERSALRRTVVLAFRTASGKRKGLDALLKRVLKLRGQALQKDKHQLRLSKLRIDLLAHIKDNQQAELGYIRDLL